MGRTTEPLFKALTDLDVEPCVLAIEQAIAALTCPQGGAGVRAGQGEGGWGGETGVRDAEGKGCGEGSSNTCSTSSLTSSSLLTQAPRFLSLFPAEDEGIGVGLGSVGVGGGAAVNVAAELEWHIRKTTRSTAFKKQLEDASARQAEENAAALKVKDAQSARIAELERMVADLGCEKEPLVTELLQAMEAYNALSRAIAGVDGEDPVFFDAVGGEERGEMKRGGGWGEGQALPERTLRGLKAIDQMVAESARLKALVFELEMHVRSLV
jgi:hypothetical protein